MKLIENRDVDMGDMLPDAWIAFGLIETLSWFGPAHYRGYVMIRMPIWTEDYSILHDRHERMQYVLLWRSGTGWMRRCAHC